MTTYYVATNGSNSGNGGSASPWKTIGYAMQADLKAGDTVVVRPGTYAEAVSITRGGSAAGDVTLKSEVPGGALIRPPSGYGYSVNVGANYVTLDGFDIKGPTVEGHGVQANNVHHVSVLNNLVHDSGASGIQFNWSDFIRVEGNETYNNARLGWFSGISIFENRNITGDSTTTGYRTIVRNNVSHDNVQETGLRTDGNGIIIDDFQSTHTAGHPNYTYPTLVDGNVLYSNGGKGIAVHWSDNVTVSNNTAWHNNLDNGNTGTWRGELSNQDSRNNTWVNNIAVADPSVNANNTAIGFYGSSAGTKWFNNISFNGTPGQASMKLEGGSNPALTAANGNKLGVDPMFVDPGHGDFHVRAGSPAINAGTSAYGIGQTEIDGGPRVVGVVDIGAHEHGTSASLNRAPGFTSADGFSIAENTTAVGRLTAQDADGDTLTFAKTGGPDAAKFAVDAQTGAISFLQAPDFENPTDSNRNNVYNLEVSVTDGKSAAVPASLQVSVRDVAESGSQPQPQPQSGGSSFFAPSARPAATEVRDTADYELGMKFRALKDGDVTALRYYRGAADASDTDTRTLHLWSSDGRELAEASVTSAPGASGWQTVTLDKPVHLAANGRYVVSYGTTQNYANTSNYFGDAVTNADGTLQTPAGASGVFSVRGGSNGGPGFFPNATWQASNYWADVVFKASTVSGATAAQVLTGTAAADSLIGGAGVDTISGLGGDDRIQGAGGADSLRGGAGADVFVYARASDSTVAAPDMIHDFVQGADRIDLRAIDAVAGGGDTAFRWIDGGEFTGAPGQLRAVSTANGLLLQGDITGDGIAEFSIGVAGHHSLVVADILF